MFESNIITIINFNNVGTNLAFYVMHAWIKKAFPERGPTLIIFLMRGERIQIALKEGHHRPASKTPFIWRFAGGLMVAQH